MFAKLKYRVSPDLVGQDRPLLLGDELIVSPAMADLIEHADDREMEHLLKNLFPIEINWSEAVA